MSINACLVANAQERVKWMLTDALSFHYGFGMPEKNLCNTVKENNKTYIKTNNKKDITPEE